MAGSWLVNGTYPADPIRCPHYAKFMRNLTQPESNAIFWLLFIIVLLLLSICARQHHVSANLKKDIESGQASASYIHNLRSRQLGIAGLCFLLSVACVIIETFALFNLEYCDGEDLIDIYWSFWGWLGVGSVTAQFGVILSFWIELSDVKHPSWAVALGTPVLVFAALMYYFEELGKLLGRKVLCRKESKTERKESGRITV